MSALPASHRAGVTWWLALIAVIAIFAGTRAGAGGGATLEPLRDWADPALPGQPAKGGAARPPLGKPVELAIPALSVRATVRPVGLDAKGALITPPAQEAGWYELGPVAGARGSAVIVGHVDSRTAPGVFAELTALKPGAVVGVLDEHGVWTIFQVRALSQHPKDQLPDRLWGPSRDRVLRLITCGGAFDGRSGHYRDNVVAHATALGRWRPPVGEPYVEPPWDRLTPDR